MLNVLGNHPEVGGLANVIRPLDVQAVYVTRLDAATDERWPSTTSTRHALEAP
jgi:hypothetical protein